LRYVKKIKKFLTINSIDEILFIQFYEKVVEKSILEYSVEENSRFKYKKKIKLPK